MDDAALMRGELAYVQGWFATVVLFASGTWVLLRAEETHPRLNPGDG